MALFTKWKNVSNETVETGKVYYLDATNGNDSWDGDKEKPWKTIAKAQEVATEGDTVFVYDGNYGEFAESTDRTMYLRYKAVSGESPVLTYIAINGAGTPTPIDSCLIFDGFTIEEGVTIPSASHLKFKNCEVTIDGDYAISGVGSDYVTIENCTLNQDSASIYEYGIFWVSRNNTINSNLYGWELDETNTGIAGAGLTEEDLTALNLTSGEDAGKGTTNYQGVSGNIAIYAGQVISNKIISPSYQLHLLEGAELHNCLIRHTDKAAGVPMILADEAIIYDCDIDASLLGNVGIAVSITGKIKRCKIWLSSTGISINNTSAIISECENNYIYNLEVFDGAHADGITTRVSSGAGVIIKNNRAIASWPANSSWVTGAMFLQSQAGVLDNVTIEGNLFEGHGYNLSAGISTYDFGDNCEINNNRYYSTGWGAMSIQDGITLASFENNYSYTSEANAINDVSGTLITEY